MKTKSIPGSLPARILASGLRLDHVQRPYDGVSWVDSEGNEWGNIIFYFDGQADDETVILMKKYGSVINHSSYKVSWSLFHPLGHPYLERTYFWEKKIKQLQLLLG